MAPRPKMYTDASDSPQNQESDSDEDDHLFLQQATKPFIAAFAPHISTPYPVKLLSDLQSIRLEPTTTLLILVFLDMFAVSLVVPLLFQYYKAAGVDNADQRELLSSLFSTAQIAGGLLMGFVTDMKLVRRRSLLFISFGGSALAYALIVWGGLSSIICSRVLVGLVKQTMTVSRALLTGYTSTESRTQHLGRLSAASTVAWIVGPAVGALFYRYVDTRAPVILACILFGLNIAFTAVWLPNDNGAEDDDSSHSSDNNSSNNEEKTARESILAKLKSCFKSQALGSVVLAQLIYTWVSKATNYSELGNFYEDMYGLEPHQRGYISSYQQFLQFVVQSTLVTAVMRWSGDERQTISFFILLMALAFLMNSIQSLALFLTILCPVTSLGFAMTHLSLQSLLTHVAPQNSIFSVLAALDVLQNAVSVSVPFYRTFLFRHLTASKEPSCPMSGDPDPVAWLQSSALHWLIAGIATSCLLLFCRNCQWNMHETKKSQ